jgi:UDP-N-acetylmuramoylalanine--D-glutamate ligase
VRYVDDSKATNPHAAARRWPRRPPAPVVWVVGGCSRGVGRRAGRRARRGLRAAVVIGTRSPAIVAALARHAPDVPVVEVAGRHDGLMIPARTAEPPAA